MRVRGIGIIGEPCRGAGQPPVAVKRDVQLFGTVARIDAVGSGAGAAGRRSLHVRRCVHVRLRLRHRCTRSGCSCVAQRQWQKVCRLNLFRLRRFTHRVPPDSDNGEVSCNENGPSSGQAIESGSQHHT